MQEIHARQSAMISVNHVKAAESQALADDVNAWLAAGNETTTLKMRFRHIRER